MDARRSVPFAAFLQLLFSLISSAEIKPILHRKYPLCDLGCECPAEGQSFLLLDCSQRGLYKLPTSLQFDSPLSILSFQGNHITSLAMSTFSIVDGIEELDLSVNKIMKIDNFTFVRFKSLALLRLSHNYLSEITPGLLEGLSNLRVLEVGHNALQKLEKSTFRATPSLQELRLQYNPIFELPEDIFQ
ncbi:UNVERIFIED_CONTAM: Asporin [Trichonephila clavipes]